MDRFAKTIKSWKLLTVFEKPSILDVLQGSEYTSRKHLLQSVTDVFSKVRQVLQGAFVVMYQ